MKRVIVSLVLVALLATGCQRITKKYSEVDAPKDAPKYTVAVDPNKSPAAKR